jgi:hypothetical protein
MSARIPNTARAGVYGSITWLLVRDGVPEGANATRLPGGESHAPHHSRLATYIVMSGEKVDAGFTARRVLSSARSARRVHPGPSRLARSDEAPPSGIEPLSTLSLS